MYHLELINEVYPHVSRPTYGTQCMNICKVVGPTIMLTCLSGWIGYIVGSVHSNHINHCIGSN